MVRNATKSSLFILAGIFIIANFVVDVDCDCCYTKDFVYSFHDACGDGTLGTPCCGYGQCNIFCCNCDGGCRRPPSNSLPGNSSAREENMFLKLDRNKDGFVDKEEARDYLLEVVYVNHTEKMTGFEEGFKKLDKLGNGKLVLPDIVKGKK